MGSTWVDGLNSIAVKWEREWGEPQGLRNPLLTSCSLGHVSWGEKPWEARGFTALGFGGEPLCTSHSPNKAMLVYSPFQIMYLVIFVSRFLFFATNS